MQNLQIFLNTDVFWVAYGIQLLHISSSFSKADIDKAVAAAKKAFSRYSEWRTMDASQRGLLLLKLADLIESQARYLAELETLDCGKPVRKAEEEVYYSASVLRYYAGKADKIMGNTIPAGKFTITHIPDHYLRKSRTSLKTFSIIFCFFHIFCR